MLLHNVFISKECMRVVASFPDFPIFAKEWPGEEAMRVVDELWYTLETEYMNV